MYNILVVDDVSRIRSIFRKYAEFEGYDVTEAKDGIEALQLCRSQDFDVIILDIMMPKIDGFSTCRKIREIKTTPVIMLSARGEEYDRIHGFEMGVDDYVVKPFYMGELLARIRVAKRLSKKEDEEIKKYQKDYLEVDFISRKVLIDQEEIHLTPIEFNLLKLLIEHRGKVLTHNYIQKEIWGYQDHSNQNALRVFMATLRRKIEKDTNHPHFIVTEVGVGYYFKD